MTYVAITYHWYYLQFRYTFVFIMMTLRFINKNKTFDNNNTLSYIKLINKPLHLLNLFTAFRICLAIC